MKKRKIVDTVLIALASLIGAAGVIHTVIGYAEMYVASSQMHTSAPAWVALFIFVPYALGIVALIAALLIIRAVRRRKNNLAHGAEK